MKVPYIEEIGNREQARDLAVDYQQWQSEQSLSYEEVNVWDNFFTELGEKFDLTEEFQENAII